MRFRFREFELDLEQMVLRHGRWGARPLPPRAMLLLAHLIEHRDRVVGRSELLDTVWSDVVVSDTSLSTAVRQIRRAFGERASDSSLIRTVAGRGYCFAGEVLELDPRASVGAVPPAVREAALVQSEQCEEMVGRAGALAHLQSQLGVLLRDSHGHGGLLFVRGEVGCGKTLFVQHALAPVRRLGEPAAEVLRIRCESRDGVPPLWPFVLVLRELLRRKAVGQVPPSTPAASHDNELVHLLHELGVELHVPLSPAEAVEPALARFTLLDAVTRALCATGNRPRIVWLEDFHCADASSRALLSFAATHLQTSRVLLLVTERTGAAPAGAICAGASTIDLDPLSPADCETLLDRWVPAPLLGPCRRARLVETASGNPLLLRELARAAVAGQLVADGDDETAFQNSLPGSLRELVLRRLQDLSPSCQRLLGAAACVGVEFGSARLRRLLALPRESVEAALMEAVLAGLLVSTTDVSDRYAFRHACYRDVVYDACPRTVRAQWHGSYARQIEAESAQSAPCDPVQLQHHYRVAGAPDKALEYAREAIASASRLGAYDTASTVLSDTERTAGLIVDPTTRVELLLQGAASRAALGATPDELQRLYRHAFKLAEALGSAELLARAALGYCGCVTFRGTSMDPWPPGREAVSLLTKARDAQPDESVYSVLVQARLGVALGRVQRMQESDSLTCAAVAEAQRLGDPRTLCEALLQRARSLTGPGRTSQRDITAHEALLWAERSGLTSLAQAARHERAMARLQGGLLTATDLAELSDFAAPDLDPSEALQRMGWAMMAACLRGELERAEGLLRGARELAERTHPVAGARLLDGYAWELDRLRGRGSSIDRLKGLSLRDCQLAPWMAFGWLFAVIDSGHLLIARAGYRPVMRLLPRLVRDRHWLGAVAVASYAAETFDDAKGAADVYERLLPFADENVTAGDAGIFLAPVAHYLGGMAMVFGDHAAAHRHYDQAEAQAEQLGATVPVLLARKHRALLRMRQGSRVRAGQELERVRRELVAHGLSGLACNLNSETRRSLALAAH